MKQPTNWCIEKLDFTSFRIYLHHSDDTHYRVGEFPYDSFPDITKILRRQGVKKGDIIHVDPSDTLLIKHLTDRGFNVIPENHVHVSALKQYLINTAREAIETTPDNSLHEAIDNGAITLNIEIDLEDFFHEQLRKAVSSK